jgi:hypothetical protein
LDFKSNPFKLNATYVILVGSKVEPALDSVRNLKSARGFKARGNHEWHGQTQCGIFATTAS